MTTTKYYLKEKCRDCPGCLECNGKGFTRGADVTELIKWLLKDGKITTAYIKNYLKIIEVVEE
ncbi:MAG: hypothetical protein AABY10_02800 [Nanoarchaeota archaeon]